MWLSDMFGKYITRFISWEGRSPVPPAKRIGHIILDAPREGAKVLVDLKDLQTTCAFKAKTNSGAKYFKNGHVRWGEVMEHLGIPPSHLCRPHTGGDQGDLRMHSYHGSCAATLVVLCHGASMWLGLVDLFLLLDFTLIDFTDHFFVRVSWNLFDVYMSIDSTCFVIAYQRNLDVCSTLLKFTIGRLGFLVCFVCTNVTNDVHGHQSVQAELLSPAPPL